jgi:hypothetical protein
MSVLTGIPAASMAADASKAAAAIQQQTDLVGLQYQGAMFEVQNEWQERQWKQMIPFIEQEKKKFGYEERAWQYGDSQQEYGRKQMGYGELQMKHGESEMDFAKRQMEFGTDKMDLGREEMDFLRGRMELGGFQQQFAQEQMQLSEYGMDQFQEIYQKGPPEFQDSERWRVGQAVSQMSREKNADALAKFGAANGIGGEALALELEKQMAPIDQGIMMGQYDAHQADFQRELGNAQAMSQAYQGGGDSYGGGSGLAGGAGAGGAAGGGIGSPMQVGGPTPNSGGVTSVQTPDYMGQGNAMAQQMSQSGRSAATGGLGASQAWQQGMANSMAPLHQVGADVLGQKLSSFF